MAIPLLTFTVKDEKANVSKELNHIKEVKRSSGINETISLSFRTIDRPTNTGYSMVEGENLIVYQGHEYRIKQVSKMPSYKNVVCTHIFSDLVGVQRYNNIVGTFTLASCVDYVLFGTGWSFTVDADVSGKLATFGEDQFGKGNVVKLIEAVCKDIFKVEFQILPNKTIRFTSRLSSDKGEKYEYGKNIKTISEKFDSTSLRTQIMGTYEYTEGQDAEGNDIKVERSVVYTSPNASIYGIIEAEPITDSDVRSDYEMYALLEERLNDEIQYSLDISAVDFEGKELGETVTVNHAKMGIVGSKARILQLDEIILEVDGVFKFVPDVITLGNYVFGTFRTKVKDKINRLEEEIEKLKKRQPSVFFLSAWRIGNQNALAQPGVILPTNANLPNDITAEIKFDEMESLIGQIITLKSVYSEYHVRVTEYTATGSTDYDASSNVIRTKKYPYDGLQAIAITITDVPLSEYVEGTHRKQILGVRFNQGGKQSYFLEEFKIGEFDCLEMEAVELLAFDRNQIIETVPYKTLQEHEGLSLRLKPQYADYNIRISINGTEYTKANLPSLATMKLPTAANAYILVQVSKGENVQYYGISFVQKDFLGIITIKNRNENGMIISTREQPVNTPGIVEIEADEIPGYELITELPIEVELSWQEPEKEIHIDYAASGEFLGKIIIKGRDEDGKIIYTREVEVDEVGNHIATADKVQGYDLVSNPSITVTLTLRNPDKTVYFQYEANEELTLTGYVMEFTTAPIDLVTRFNFSNPDGYDSIESVTLGIQHSGTTFTNLAWEPIMSGDRYIGITVRASTAPSGAKISIQAVCYAGGG